MLTWTRISATLNPTATTSKVKRVIVRAKTNSTVPVNYADIMLQSGDVIYPWSPNVAEMYRVNHNE